MPYTQENRLIAIDTPLGKDTLLLSGFSGTEGISRLFSFELTLLSENPKISFDDIIGKNVSLSIFLASGDKRYFNGIIVRFSQGRGGGDAEAGPRFSHYKAIMAPWLWLLTMTRDSRIFQKLSVPDIVEKIFKEKGFSDFKMKLRSSYAKREYCVQYRETDFSFISRLLEDEGIYYYFDHEKGKHTLIIADTPQDHKSCPNQKSARYQLSAGNWQEEDVITSLEKMQEIRPGKYTLNAYNFEIPNTGLEVNVPSKYKLGPGEREIYDYPASYTKRKEGDKIAKIRMEEEEAQITTILGSSNCRAFSSGYRFRLKNYYRDDINDKDYVVTSIHHEVCQNFKGEAELSYSNQFTCIPFDVPYRPPRTLEKPVVRGNQTAIVVGPSGEEIYTDEHSRVKVQFHWDREGKRDENSSCWIRVSQLWAGAGWGAIHIPRIGQEVIVDFLEGDPDKPLITGYVYNASNMPPYKLPDEKTKSSIKSNTVKGGGSANELLMEDKKEKTRVVLSNAYGHKITEDEESQTLTINTRDGNIISLDDKNRCILAHTTDGHALLMDDQNRKMRIGSREGYCVLLDDKNERAEITTKDGHTALLNDKEKKISLISKKGHEISIDDSGESITLEDSKKKHTLRIDIGGGKVIISTSSGDIDISAPSGTLNLKAKEINIKASAEVNVNASSDLKLKGGMNVASEAGMEHKTKGTMVTAESSAVHTIKGAIVKIN
ncbi:MAG: type VI secretion system Vgr family protein [bacterium]